MSNASTPPPGIDLKANRGPRIIGSMISLVVLTTVFVIARLVSRRIAHAGLWWDDLWVVLTLCLSYGQPTIILISQDSYGFGKHIYILGPQTTGHFLTAHYFYLLLYFMTTSAVKVCILTFYWRIFFVQELKPIFYTSYGVVACYFLGSTLASVFVCTPIQRSWNRTIPGTCSKQDDVVIIPGAINCVLDFLIILIPLPLLWRLQASVERRSILTAIFVCAGLVTAIVSIIRLVVLSRLSKADVTWNFVDSSIWSVAEPCIGVISACIPSLRPLVSLLHHRTARWSRDANLSQNAPPRKKAQEHTSGGSSGMFSKDRATDGINSTLTRHDDTAALDPRRDQWSRDVTVRGGRVSRTSAEDEISLEELIVPAGGIKVRNEVFITRSIRIEYKDRVF